MLQRLHAGRLQLADGQDICREPVGGCLDPLLTCLASAFRSIAHPSNALVCSGRSSVDPRHGVCSSASCSNFSHLADIDRYVFVFVIMAVVLMVLLVSE